MNLSLSEHRILNRLYEIKKGIDQAYWELQATIAILEEKSSLTPSERVHYKEGDETQEQLLDANERKPATIESELDNLEKHEGNGGAV